MNTENKILEVGDVLYNNKENPTVKVTITRVTEHQATDGEKRMKRVSMWGNRYAAIGGSYYGYEFGDENTEALYQKYCAKVLIEKEKKEIVRQLMYQTNFSKLSLEKLRQIKAIIER